MSGSTLLLAARVTEICKACMFTNSEDRRARIEVPGIRTAGFGFHPTRLNEHAPEIRALLDELPDTFRQGVGGASLVDARWDRRGRDWSEHYSQIEMLLAMGLALKYVTITVPPAIWPSLPGGLPYIAIVQE